MKETAMGIPDNRIHAVSSEFAMRRLDHHHSRLLAGWTACPECGDPSLERPTGEDLARVPDAAGVCAGCGAVFASAADGRPVLLAAGLLRTQL